MAEQTSQHRRYEAFLADFESTQPLLPRWQHYEFTHRALPSLLFTHPTAVTTALTGERGMPAVERQVEAR